MTTLRPYLTYQESDLNWSGRVPKHWDLVQLARLADEGKVRNAGLQEKTVLSLSYGRIIIKTNIYAGLSPADFSTYQIVEPGNVVLRLTDLQNDQRSLRVGIAETRGIITSAYVCLKPSEFMEPRFLYRMLHDFDVKKMFYGMGAGVRQGLSYKELRKTIFAIPPLDEQRAIADFLDGMDARITRFIAARRKMIVLLEEKKQAVINQAVTRGLVPSAPTKDSGVDWLGKIPAHWAVPQIGHFSRVGNGSTPSRSNYGYWTNGSFPWLNSASVHAGLVTSSNQFVTPLALAECHLPVVKPGDLLVAITGQGKTRGTAALVGLTATINQHMAYIKIRSPRISPAFLHKVLLAAYLTLRELSSDSGSTKGALTCTDIRHFRVPVPPVTEQQAIVNHVDRETSHIDALVSRHRREIELMQEYRTRLISDVVTGKLDVRGVELAAVEEVIGEEIETAMEDESVEEFEEVEA